MTIQLEDLKQKFRSQRISWSVLVAALTIFLPLMLFMWPDQNVRSNSIIQAQSYQSAQVISVDGSGCDGISDNDVPCATLEVNIEGQSGINVIMTRGDYFNDVKPRDGIVVAEVEANGDKVYMFHSVERLSGLLWLVALTAAVVVSVTGRKGVVALLGLVMTYALFWFFLLPGIAQGGSPVNYAIVTCALVLVVVLYGTHGVNLKTTSALMGTVSGLGIAMLLGGMFSSILNMSGVTSQTEAILFQGDSINLQTLAMAGLLVASLGVLNDITVAQSSAVWSMAHHYQGQPMEVIRRAMVIGRDHASSAIYTIAFSLVGASIGAMVIAGGQGMTLWAWVQDEAVAETLIQVLVGAIGLVLAMPLTTILAVFLYNRDPETEVNEHHHSHHTY